MSVTGQFVGSSFPGAVTKKQYSLSLIFWLFKKKDPHSRRDRRFATGMDPSLGKIIGYEMLGNYIRQLLRDPGQPAPALPLQWTASKAGLVELIYALHQLGEKVLRKWMRSMSDKTIRKPFRLIFEKQSTGIVQFGSNGVLSPFQVFVSKGPFLFVVLFAHSEKINIAQIMESATMISVDTLSSHPTKRSFTPDWPRRYTIGLHK